MYNKVVAAPGQNLLLGASGGVLLLQPPGIVPGAMTLTDLKNRVWHLLREDGPDTTGFGPPTTGDFNTTVVGRDLNIALATFIGEAGCPPSISDRQDTFPVFAVLDYPLPPSLVSLARVEYTPAGQQTYTLLPTSFTEYDQLTGAVQPTTMGQPRYYRRPFAGYIRLSPAPGPGNAIADTMTFYYQSNGTLLLLPQDTPGIPPQFHMALVYRVLSDYWIRKQDIAQAKEYERKYEVMLLRAKAYEWDADRSAQPTIGGDDFTDYTSYP